MKHEREFTLTVESHVDGKISVTQFNKDVFHITIYNEDEEDADESGYIRLSPNELEVLRDFLTTLLKTNNQ